MKTIRLAAAAALCAGLAACIPPAPEPSPPAVPARTPTPAPAPAPEIVLPAPENWMDAPRTSGDWSYQGGATQTRVLYGDAQSGARFVMTCNRPDRQIALARAGEASAPVAVRILTETQNRVLTGRPVGGAMPMIVATVNANDRLLDAMAFSKGRFAVETQGLPTLYIPSWAEVTRVIEDCR